MPLTPGESDRLLLHLEASLAQRRRDRGLRLNIPEARALIADAVCEWARDGLGLLEARDRARAVLGPQDVLPGVAEALPEIRVEARFDDGTRLVVVKDPFGMGIGLDDEQALAGVAADEAAGEGALQITNEGPTAIGLTSHIHLAEVNPRLRLDRAAAFGRRLAIATGETVWIRPGQSVRLLTRPIGGDRVVVGNTGVVDGPVDDPVVRERALATLRACGYLDIVDGTPRGEAATAETAVAEVMRGRRERGAQA